MTLRSRVVPIVARCDTEQVKFACVGFHGAVHWKARVAFRCREYADEDEQTYCARVAGEAFLAPERFCVIDSAGAALTS
jgi:hypothetical protein